MLVADLKRIAEHDRAGTLLVIHYKCDSLKADPCKVKCIAVRTGTLSTAKMKVFGVGKSEAECLSDFVEFAEAHNDCLWLNWNMHKSYFGFEHIRYLIAAILNKTLPAINYLNLSNTVTMQHGNCIMPIRRNDATAFVMSRLVPRCLINTKRCRLEYSLSHALQDLRRTITVNGNSEVLYSEIKGQIF